MSAFDLLAVDCNSPSAGREFTESLHQTGFAVVKNHSIDPKLVDEVYAEWQAFFARPEVEKIVYKNEATAEKGNSGYFPMLSEHAKYTDIGDLKEFFHFFPWAEVPSGISDKTKKLFEQMNSLAATLLGWVEANLPAEIQAGLSMPLSQMIINSPRTLIRIINYPPISGTEAEGAVRAAAHEDIGMMTLLPAATAKGLQVQDTAGQWHEVPCDYGTIVINAADHLTAMTQGYLPATTHRVVNPEGELARKPRLSMPLFLHARDEVMMPDGRNAKEYLFERLREIGIL